MGEEVRKKSEKREVVESKAKVQGRVERVG
jgi:hypothetical protein